MYSPEAISIPELRALDTPSFFLCTTIILESFSPYILLFSALASFDPSSTRIISS